MTDPPFSFNLWTEPWIRVTCNDGTEAELGIGPCLASAHTLAALSDPSPLVVGGTHRLLAAILQACYAPRDLGEIAAVLKAGQFDGARLDAFAASHGPRLDLFHPTAPFLQTGDVPLDGWRKPGKDAPKEVRDSWAQPGSVAVLFAEVPGATNRAHFHHVTDSSHRLCPACCARGLVTIPAFARAEGGGPEGYRPAITGGPPVYVLPMGRTLFEALSLSLVAPGFMPRKADPSRSDVAIWNADPVVPRKYETSSVSYLESMCFPVRRVRLFPQHETSNCTMCAQRTAVCVREAYLKMGVSLTKSMGVWDDPFVGYQMPKKAGNEPYPIQLRAGKELWREYSGLLLAEQESKLRPRVVEQLTKLIERGAVDEMQRLRFRCVGLRTDQAKVEVWLDEALEAPPALLGDDLAAHLVEDALKRADALADLLNSIFAQHFRPWRQVGTRTSKEVVRFKTLRARMAADYWGRLAPLFRRWVFELADETARDEAERAWVRTIIHTAQGAFDRAAEQAGDRADALRARVLARDACQHQLARKRKEWLGE